DLLEADFMKLQEVETDVQVISGQIAFVGKVTGTARVIKGRDDFARFTKGDILVTNQTTPEFVPLMRQASAVVTDQGGITCHAAIVSRELQIPCIIGTDVATRIIQDGEQILVDAEIGVVSRLN
ncbi:MAG: phosphoenolpyruvate synthase, partial [Candidatus Kerfeldbacteria bacterium CG15_BIG_FIL_POST_REV_8_21_14_020_45_12]